MEAGSAQDPSAEDMYAVQRINAGNAAEIDQAFAVLRHSLNQLDARRARTTAAGVKSEMLRLTSGKFAESDLGFPSFRCFLDAAQSVGIVTIDQPYPPRGQDVVVALNSRVSANTPRAISGPRVRPDLWAAFVDWNTAFIRLWDCTRGRAVFLSAQQPPIGAEQSAMVQLRERYAQHPEDFLIIEPIGQQQQIEWMRTFADANRDKAPELVSCLEEPRPAAAFTRALRSDPELNAAWRSRFSELVREAIESWVTENDLRIDPTEAPSTLSRATRPVATEATEALNRMHRSTSTDRALRGQLLAVLAQLSTEELLQIRVPIVYALRL
jgi:hypothetical protein